LTSTGGAFAWCSSWDSPAGSNEFALTVTPPRGSL